MNDALQRAIDLRAAGRAEEAISLLAELLEHEPDNGEIACREGDIGGRYSVSR
ncbi:tetratricopeptide repeat protein [Paenibacillus thiaminolyticus]|uniref:tetratricopeptide repeat protein n=1 Tax=Paenibacillus thiaminolyticus TaxID=49283 RepID=UPI0035A57DFD